MNLRMSPYSVGLSFALMNESHDQGHSFDWSQRSAEN